MPYAATSAPTGWLLCDGTAVSRSTYAALFSAISTTFGAGDGSTTFNVPDLRGKTVLGYGAAAGSVSATISAVNTTSNVITIGASNFYVGQPLKYTNGGSNIGGITSGNTYYAIPTSSTTIKLAASIADADAGTEIDLTSTGGNNGTLAYILTQRNLNVQGGEETHAISTAELPSHTHSVTIYGTGGGGFNLNHGSFGGADPTVSTAVGSNSAHNNLSPFMVLNYIIKQ